MKTNKVWFITGTSRGFGYEIAKTALEQGDRVVATVRNKPDDLAKKLGHPDRLQVVTLDITSESNIQTAVEKAMQRFGRIDVLVNNAGHGILSGVEEATDAEIRSIYDVNVFGLLNVTRAVLPYLRRQRSGHIINLSSVGGLTGITGWGVYGSTKFAVEGLTEALAVELAPLGIYATAVEPGFFRTDFLDASSLLTSPRIIDDYAESVGKMRSFTAEVNHKQPGSAVKAAQAIVQLGHADKPPVHLPLGRDTLALFKEKMDKFYADIDSWHDTITGTDHDDAKAHA